ncbi:MAG: hypothetical protein KAU49_00595 [Candidatus Krumholzibacteria bacterium]|nr:hypothetical protein [Candidatus Krumholzibacteria bacterium]
MKTIVISGAKSNVGKTTLAGKMGALLPGSVCVKLGHGAVKEGVDNVFYHAGTPYERIKEDNPQADFLIIESNRILEEIDPDLVIYLPADDPKPSAALAETNADLIRGCEMSDDMVRLVVDRLGIDTSIAAAIIMLACEGGVTEDGNEDE